MTAYSKVYVVKLQTMMATAVSALSPVISYLISSALQCMQAKKLLLLAPHIKHNILAAAHDIMQHFISLLMQQSDTELTCDASNCIFDPVYTVVSIYSYTYPHNHRCYLSLPCSIPGGPGGSIAGAENGPFLYHNYFINPDNPPLIPDNVTVSYNPYSWTQVHTLLTTTDNDSLSTATHTVLTHCTHTHMAVSYHVDLAVTRSDTLPCSG